MQPQWFSCDQRRQIVYIMCLLDSRRFLFTGITRTEILGNALIMLMAGYDTTANSMVFLSYCIAQEPEVQKNLLKEINETKDKHVRNWVAFYQIEDQTSRKEKSPP